MADADPPMISNHASLRIDSLRVVELDKAYLAAHNIVGLNDSDSRSRAFNLLRTRLSKALPGNRACLVGLTSATPGAGKTFICSNLALSLAKVAEGPVILVDLDLRRGSVAEELGLVVTAGVRDFLLGDASLQDVAVSIEGMSLTVLPTRAELEESAELLSGPRFTELLAALRNQPANTIVLFDLPPVFANDDAMLAIERFDGYVLVIDSTVTRKSHVEQAQSMLRPAHCFGTILNRYIGTMIERDGYGSTAYSKYYDQMMR